MILFFNSASSLPLYPNAQRAACLKALLAHTVLCVMIHWINNFPAKFWSFRFLLCSSFIFPYLLQLWISQQLLRMVSGGKGGSGVVGSYDYCLALWSRDLGISFPVSFPISAEPVELWIWLVSTADKTRPWATVGKIVTLLVWPQCQHTETKEQLPSAHSGSL